MSGDEVAAILGTFGFVKVAQRGGHMKLKRVVAGAAQTLTIPAHRELDSGTLRAIIRQASRFVPEGELSRAFYN
jgi:predicted RNA binding protein YcfA (HicA-like mRNA interferase family)